MEENDSFHQIKLRFVDEVQYHYEVIRPVVLKDMPVGVRSDAVEIDRTTIREKARRFLAGGMLALVDGRAATAGRKGHEFPDPVARHILYCKKIWPSVHLRELTRIVWKKFGYKTNHHTLKEFLDRFPIPIQLELKLKTFHDFEDAYAARYEVVRMHFEGWNAKSIAGVLKIARSHVHRLIAAYARDDFAALEDSRTRPANHPKNQLTIAFLQETAEAQEEFPGVGAYRLKAILEQRRTKAGDQTPVPSFRTISRAMIYARVFLGAPGGWPRPPLIKPREGPTPLPYDPIYRHKYWFIDIRYVVKLDGRWAYSICILEGHSRCILAGTLSLYQDELEASHAEFIELFNTTAHWAHRARSDGLRTPEQVLDGAQGRPVNPDELREVFRGLQVERTINAHGRIRIQHFSLYAERGLSRQRVSVWMHEDWLRIEYEQTLLAQYQFKAETRRRALKAVSKPVLYPTRFTSPQMEILELDEDQWLKVLRLPPPAPRRTRVLALSRQLPLLPGLAAEAGSLAEALFASAQRTTDAAED